METKKQTPVQGTENTNGTFRVSSETAYFLTALKSFEQAKSDYFTALTEYYGEEQGLNMYNDDLPDLDRAEQRITGGLLRSIGDNLGNLNSNEI